MIQGMAKMQIVESNNNSTSSNLCEVCNLRNQKYCCPRCRRKTCSLSCCIEHKKQEQCDGKRDKTSYVSLSNFNDSQLRSDYHYLEDVLRTTGAAKREREANPCNLVPIPAQKKRDGSTKRKREPEPVTRADLESIVPEQGEEDERRDQHPLLGGDGEGGFRVKHGPRVEKLVRQAASRGTKLMLMPTGMSRRKANTTTYDQKHKMLKWRVEWQLHPPVPDVTLIEHRLPEQTTLKEVLLKYFEPCQGNAPLRHKLKAFCIAWNKDELSLFLEKIPCPQNGKEYYKLDSERSLQQALKNKTVIEFPIIHLVLPEQQTLFPVCYGLVEEVQLKSEDTSSVMRSSNTVVEEGEIKDSTVLTSSKRKIEVGEMKDENNQIISS